MNPIFEPTLFKWDFLLMSGVQVVSLETAKGQKLTWKITHPGIARDQKYGDDTSGTGNSNTLATITGTAKHNAVPVLIYL